MKRFLDELASARLAIILFFVLAGISILGTIIPQGQAEEFYFSKYGQGLGKLILFFQLSDAYHSWWYISVLLLFLLNLTTCSFKRLPFSFKLFKRDPSEIKVESLPNKLTLNLRTDLTRLGAYIQGVLSFRKVEADLQAGSLYYKRLYNYGFFSVYIVHFSLVVIIIGALIGALFGWRGNISILEGETSNIVQPFRKKEPLQLDFSLKLNKFILESYPDGRPKEYISNITVIDGNKTLDTIIKVNQPFKYKDITFYQASYNIIPEFKIRVNIKGKEEIAILSPFNPIQLKERYSITLQDYGEAHGFIYLKIWALDEEKGETRQGFIISGFPPLKLDFPEDQLVLEFVEIAKLNYMTGLQAKKDPVLWIVYLGFILIMLGLFLVYYFDPKTFWIYVKKKEEELEIAIGGYAKRERDSLKIKIEELAERLKKDFS